MNEPNNNATKENPVGRFMVAVGAAIELGNTAKMLLIQRSPEADWQPLQWEIGYGRIDQHEDPEEGLRREVHEEIGITDIKIKKILRVWHIYRGSKKPENEVIGITYFCSTNTKEIKLSSEHVAYQWIDPHEALKLVSLPGIQEDIKRLISIKKDENYTH